MSSIMYLQFVVMKFQLLSMTWYTKEHKSDANVPIEDVVNSRKSKLNFRCKRLASYRLILIVRIGVQSGVVKKLVTKNVRGLKFNSRLVQRTLKWPR